MRPLLPLSLAFTAVLLCGCPDTKIPKAPPKIPEPKAAFASPHGTPDQIAHADSFQTELAGT